MALSDIEKKRIEKLFADYCDKKIPPQFRNELRAEFEIRGNEVYLFECRAPWLGEGDWTRMKVAGHVLSSVYEVASHSDKRYAASGNA